MMKKLCNDEEFKIHIDFFKNVKYYLNKNGNIVLGCPKCKVYLYYQGNNFFNIIKENGFKIINIFEYDINRNKDELLHLHQKNNKNLSEKFYYVWIQKNV